MVAKSYDRQYFDHWYRRSEHAPRSPATLERKVALAVAMAEYYLGHPVRNVLDVGCGEARWRAPLRKLRPRVHYSGLDSSAYAVSRYGRSRNIGLATFAQLEHLRLDARFDLVILSDVLHYLPPREIRAGLPGLVEMLEGLAFIEVFTRGDAVQGDRDGYRARAKSWYLNVFREAGLVPCGSNGYLAPHLHDAAAMLERVD